MDLLHLHTTMTTKPFVHSPLDPARPRAFRILELLPSIDLKGPIRCELRHCNLDDDIQYEALSYAWGDPAPGYTIVVNQFYTLSVTPNCYDALFHLRRKFHRRTLWVDAICINQCDDETSTRERNHQVMFMGKVFQKAKTVLVWLGRAEPGSTRAIARLKIITRLQKARGRPSDAEKDSSNPTSCWHLVGAKKLKNTALAALESFMAKKIVEEDGSIKPHFPAIVSMMRSPWWQRAWTLQEQVLAKSCQVYHGRQRISMNDLVLSLSERSYDLLTEGNFHHNHRARGRVSVLCFMIDLLRSHDEDPALIGHASDSIAESLLRTAFFLDAKSPLDKIYGLYGLLTSYCALPLSPPDYEATAEAVYEETVWAWIKTRHDLSILKLATRLGPLDGLPSWVPGWHREHPSYIPHSEGLVNPERYGAFSDGHFSWNYIQRYDMRVVALRDAQKFGPIASLSVPGQLRVARARYVGRVSHAVGVDKHQDDIYKAPEYLGIHMRWCRLVYDLFSHDTRMYDRARNEMFRSLQQPGIYEFRVESEEILKEYLDAFQAWFTFMLYLDRGPSSLGPAVSTINVSEDLELAPTTKEEGLRLYRDVLEMKRIESAVDVLTVRYAGGARGREALTELAKQVVRTSRDLVRVRNHALCVIDNEDMLAVANYWCREGDEVFVFPGTDCPFALRREPDGENYRLVGPMLVDRLCSIGYQEWRAEGDDLREVILI